MTRISRPSVFAAILILASSAFAQNPAAPGTAAPAAKPKPLSSPDTKTYLSVAEYLQFQLNMARRLRSRFKDTEPDLVSFGSKLEREAIGQLTPVINLGQQRGVDEKKIPQDMTQADKTNVGKLNPIKDDKKWTLAFLDLFAKESKKNARNVEAAAKNVADPDLKPFVEKAQSLIKSQNEAIEAKLLELRGRK